jgi:hypothetical protein
VTPDGFPPPPTSPRRRLERADEPDGLRPGSGGEPVGGDLAPRPGSAPVPASALADLARAFQANAEALQQVNSVQGEIARAIRRTDRSEAMIASTNALNDTFRGLTTIQREILDRLDESRRRPSRLVPMLLLALLVVFVGGTVAVVHIIDLARSERTNPFEIADRVTEARDQGRLEGGALKDAEVERAREEMEEAEARLSDLQVRYEEKQRALDDALVQKRGVEAEQQALADRLLEMRNESAARKALESEMQAANQRLAVLEPRVRDLQADLDQEKAEKSRLLQRLAEVKAGIAVEEPAPIGPEGEKPGVQAIAPSGPPVSRDARQLEAILSRVNRFLESGAGGSEYWQIRKVDGVSSDRLHGVVAYRYDPHGKLLDGADAKELVIWADRNARRVDFEFREGAKLFEGVRTPFAGGSWTLPVAQGEDLVRLWTNSGLLFLRTR